MERLDAIEIDRRMIPPLLVRFSLFLCVSLSLYLSNFSQIAASVGGGRGTAANSSERRVEDGYWTNLEPGQVSRYLYSSMLKRDYCSCEKGRAWHDDLPRLGIVGNLPFNIASPLIIQ